MPWTRIVSKPKPKPVHRCKLPSAQVADKRRIGTGSIWRCRKCKRDWEFNASYIGHHWNEVTSCDKGICALIRGHEGRCRY